MENTNNQPSLNDTIQSSNSGTGPTSTSLQEITALHDFIGTIIKLQNDSLVEPIEFSSKLLVSAARISAAYDYTTLHTFCVEKLEGLSLGSIERLRIGRALDLKSWEERAYQELSERDEIITREEMLTLGADAYFQVASMREKRQKGQINQLSSDLNAMRAPKRPSYYDNLRV